MSTYGHLWNLVAFETQRVSVAALVPSCFSHIFFKNFNNVHVLVNITKCMTFVIRFSITKCFWKRCIFRCCCITTFNFHWSKCNMRCVHIWAQSRNCMHPFTRVIFSLVNNAVVTLHQTPSCWGYSPTNVSDLYIHQFRITLTPYIYFFYLSS